MHVTLQPITMSYGIQYRLQATYMYMYLIYGKKESTKLIVFFYLSLFRRVSSSDSLTSAYLKYHDGENANTQDVEGMDDVSQ
mgnify:CR=1 FL=1